MLSRSFAADKSAPAAARQALDDLNGHMDPALKDDARLMVSEVVTNAVIHGHAAEPGEVELNVWANGEEIRVSVTDRGRGFVAEERPRAADHSGGWGLVIVDQLADRWGVDLSGGTEVWFEVRRPGSAYAGAGCGAGAGV